MALTRPRYSQIYDTDYKQSVRVATTVDVGNLLATGNMTNSVDNVTLVTNDRVLVKDQTDAKQNGLYRVVTAGTGSNGTWIRTLDADANDKVTSGMTTTISEGDINAGKTFKLSTPDPITLGTTDLIFIDPFVVTASAGGSINQVQFNDTGGTLNGSPGFTFNKTSNAVSIAGRISTANISVNGNVSATRFFGDGSQLTGIDATSIQNSGTIVKTYSNGNVTVTGNLVPSANVTYNLGSPTQRWNVGYFAGNTLDLGGAQISVNPVTGTFTFTGNGASTDLGGTSTFNPSGNVSIGGNLFVSGAVYIAGNTSTISTNNVVFNDALIYLANGNPTDFLDIGSVGNFTRSSLFQHTGFVRDATDGVWKLFEGVEPVPTTTVDFGSASYATALIGNLVTRSNVTVGGNIRLSRALLTSAGSGGDPGQYLSSTGTGIAWTTIDFSTLSDGVSTTVTADPANVNVTVNTTAVASFSQTSLVVQGDVHATLFRGNGALLTGLITPIPSQIYNEASNVTVTASFVNVAINGSNVASFGSTNLIVGNILPTANNVSNIGSATSKFRIIHAQATQAQYADLAEIYTSDQQYLPGTVLIFGGEQEVTQSTSSHDTRIAGVVSTDPAYLMNSTVNGVAVALQGRVPCRVLGPVIKGDRLVASEHAGVAQKLMLTLYEPGCIIGKALENHPENNIKTIEVVVGRV